MKGKMGKLYTRREKGKGEKRRNGEGGMGEGGNEGRVEREERVAMVGERDKWEY